MNYVTTLGFVATGAIATIVFPQVSYAQVTYTGVVEQVWEDGFRLRVDDRTLTVDSWDLYGDHTPNYLQEGDQISVVGELEGGELDALSITPLAP